MVLSCSFVFLLVINYGMVITGPVHLLYDARDVTLIQYAFIFLKSMAYFSKDVSPLPYHFLNQKKLQIDLDKPIVYMMSTRRHKFKFIPAL